MANRDQFDERDSQELDRPAACLVCEAMLPDAVDGSLSEAEQKAFDKHVAGCMACADELAEAQRGAAWLQMLKGHAPEPSISLLTKILAQTTGAEVVGSPLIAQEPRDEWATQDVVVRAPNVVMMPAVLPQVSAPKPAGRLLIFRQKVAQIFTIENAHAAFQPRLAMTAAMAFFSVALTLNMTGVKLSSFHASNFTPSGIRRTFADTTASASRSFHNMRVVYQVESRLDDMREDDRSEERAHSATPYSQPAEPAQAPSQNTPNQSAPNQNDQQQGDSKDQQTPKGHSSLEFPVMHEPQRISERGV